MKRSFAIALGSAALGAALIVGGVAAQGPPPSMPPGQMPPDQRPRGPMAPGSMPHGMHEQHHPGGSGEMLPGQDAFGAMAEVVRILESDPNTDWSKVDLERLRQHLIDMNEVTLHAAVRQTDLPDGARFEVTGAGRTADAIRRMLGNHTAELDALPEYAATAETVPGGVRWTVRAERSGDAAGIARIRGLGFIGLLTLGDHHPMHHLALARGEQMHH